MNKSYFDESYFRMPVDGSEILLCNRKISTYVNALAKAGFAIEQMDGCPTLGRISVNSPFELENLNRLREVKQNETN